MAQMDDYQLPKANSQQVFHAHEKPSHMVHLNHPQLRQDQPIYVVVLEMEKHAFYMFLKHNC
ncbi:hypothetical protein SESBI_28113 [Sesbania bispinosa]|nr:hypothetical protein SESBI_28113 [Sesbania bispinosa]